MKEILLENKISLIKSSYPIKGAGAGRLDFDKPYVVNGLIYSRKKEISPGLTIGQEIANNVDDLLKLHEGQTLVDLGCGPGLIATHLTDKLGATGWLYCIDASEAMLKEASNVLFCRNVTLIHSDIHTTNKILPEKADAAILSGNVHLLSNKHLAFSSIRKALKPDGKLVVVCHTYFSNKETTNFFASTLDLYREKRPDLWPDGLRLPMMNEKELNSVINTIRNVGFNVHAHERDTWSSDTLDVFGHPPEITIKKRLQIIDPNLSDLQLDQTAKSVLNEISRGREAQVYLLCTQDKYTIKSGIFSSKSK